MQLRERERDEESETERERQRVTKRERERGSEKTPLLNLMMASQDADGFPTSRLALMRVSQFGNTLFSERVRKGRGELLVVQQLTKTSALPVDRNFR